jgi:hypothetical protein
LADTIGDIPFLAWSPGPRRAYTTFLNDATNNDYLFTPPKYESSYIFYGTPIIQLYLLI